MNTTSDSNTQDGDQDIARLLQAAGTRETLPDELKDRWETHFRAELSQVRTSKRRRLLLPLSAVAASVLVLLLVMQNPFTADTTPLPISIAVIAGSASVLVEGGNWASAAEGQTLAPGSTVETGEDALVGLDWAGYDLRLNANSRLRLLNDALELEFGELYVNSVGRETAVPVAPIVTALGTVRDIGTQFKVRYDGQVLTASVREGSIEILSELFTQRVDAADSSRTLLVKDDGAAQLVADDSDWAWIHTAAPPFALEGRSVLEFLQWAARESGQELRFADSAAELSAGHTRFSGDISLTGLGPERAVALVLSTTRFDARTEEGVIVVTRRESE